MMNRWDDLVALAREIEHARSMGETVDPEKARRLARGILALEEEPRDGLAFTTRTSDRSDA